MSRRAKKLLWTVAIALAALVVVLGIAAIRISQTDWFRAYVTRKIVASAEDATGGRTEIGSFHFDWRHLQAEVTDFVIHGKEPAGAAPFLRVPRLQVNLRLVPNIHHLVDISYAGIFSPQANIVVLSDGTSNIPSPKPAPSSGGPPLRPVINAAIGRFDLNNAVVAFADAKEMLTLHTANLRAQLSYSVLPSRYSGEVSFQPLSAASGSRPPVDLKITLPVVIESDRVSLNGAAIVTPQSRLNIDGSITNLRNPDLSLHATGNVALVDLRNLGNLRLNPNAPGLPPQIGVEVNGAFSSNAIQLTRLRLDAGPTYLEASGNLEGPGSALQIKAHAVFGEVAQLLNASLPEGAADLSASARVERQTPQETTLRVDNLRVSAFGATLTGQGTLQNFARYQFRGNLRGLTLAAAASIAKQRVPYAGTVSGPITASGGLHASGDLAAQVELAVAAPSAKELNGAIPLSGRISASYSQSADDLRVQNSYLALPHSRLNIDGSVARQLNVSLTTTDLNDLLAAAPGASARGLSLQGHPAQFTGAITGGLASTHIAGHLRANSFTVEGRAFDSLALDATASPSGVEVERAEVSRGPMQASFNADLALNHWRTSPSAPVSLAANLSSGDLADALALAGQNTADTSGALNAGIRIGGTLGNPTGSATIGAANGVLHGEPFDRIQAQVNLSDRLIDLASASVEQGPERISASGQLRHPPDSFTTGQLHLHVESTPIQLAQIRALQQQRPGIAGSVAINADASADAGSHDFMLTAASGSLTARNLQFDGQNYGDLSANAQSAGQNVQYRLISTFAGSNVRVNGETQLEKDYPTTLDADISNLDIEKVLAAAQRTDVAAKGVLSGTAHFSGTTVNPSGNLDIALAKAELFNEPVDTLRARASYQPQKASIQQLSMTVGGGQIALTAEYDHPLNDLKAGQLQFHFAGNGVNLARLHNVQMRRPGIGGTLEIKADGKAELKASAPRLGLSALSANLALNGVTTANKNLGNASLTANTQNNRIAFTLTSNLAGAEIQGRGTAQTTSGYPVDAQLGFANVAWAQVRDLIGSQSAESGPPGFNAITDGQVTVQGPVATPEQLRGSVRISRLEFTPVSRAAGLSAAASSKNNPSTNQSTTIALKNAEPISLTLDAGNVRIDSLHLTGAQTDIQAKGSLSLQDRSMNLGVNGNANLGVLQTLNRDISSSGSLVLDATARGTFSKPAVNGTLKLQNASFNDTQFPNGIANANGTVDFNGNGASLRNLTAESGGGKLSLNGFAVLGAAPRFGLELKASGVRVDVQQGVGVVFNANLSATGTAQASTVSGRAVVTRINYAPRTDLGSILTRSLPSVEASATPSPLLDNMKFDVQVVTSDALEVQSALAQSVEGNANLQVRGTASHPSVLGRVTLTEGKVTFFGNSYTVDSGTISFYDPLRIDPVLDIRLQTNTEGVDVTLRVNGPIDNLKLSYTSDPPLQFEEILGLLAAGTTPTTDPTLLANNPPASQSVPEMGESAILGNAVANPVANRLQRVFGVTQLKINPAFTNGSATPDATLSLQQQIARNITFTYVTEVDNANAETIRVEVTLNPEWSAAAMRDDNGIFSINLLYKRKFR